MRACFCAPYMVGVKCTRLLHKKVTDAIKLEEEKNVSASDVEGEGARVFDLFRSGHESDQHTVFVGLCFACKEEPNRVAFGPCGHMALCTHCARKVDLDTATCPYCHMRARSIVSIR